WQYRITGAHRLEWAARASAYRYRITSESGLLLDELGQDRDSLALGSGIEWRSVLADGLTLFGRLRFDGERLSSDTLSALSPSLGATWVLGPCLLRGLIGRRHRLPTLLERFGDNVLTVANPSLAEETALSADLGTRCAGELGSLSFTGFTLSARDLIVLVQNSQRSVRAENIGRARVSGVEALATISAGPASARIAYTLSDAVDTAAEAELPGIPTHRAHLTLEYQWRTFRVGWVSDFASARALARDGLNRVPSRLLHDAYIRWGWNEVLELNASAFNLTNTIRNTLDVPGAAEPVIAGLSDFLSYPLAGRTLFLGLTIRSKA
ncbi:MAG: TonB-dependent receptor, partial [Myxococcota bacterium]